MDLFRPKWVILVHFGLAKAKIKSTSESGRLAQNGCTWPFWSKWHFTAVPRQLFGLRGLHGLYCDLCSGKMFFLAPHCIRLLRDISVSRLHSWAARSRFSGGRWKLHSKTPRIIVLVAPSTGWMLFYLCFTLTTQNHKESKWTKSDSIVTRRWPTPKWPKIDSKVTTDPIFESCLSHVWVTPRESLLSHFWVTWILIFFYILIQLGAIACVWV